MWLTHAFTVRRKALLLQCSLLPSSIFTIIKLASKMYWSKRTFETCQLLCWLKQFSFDYEKVTERMQLWRGKALALDQSDCGRMYSPSNQMPETQCGHGNAKVTVLPGQSHFARKKISQSNFYQSFKKHHSLAKACIWHQAFHSQTKTALISFSLVGLSLYFWLFWWCYQSVWCQEGPMSEVNTIYNLRVHPNSCNKCFTVAK